MSFEFPQLKTLVYWNEKDSFLLEADTYADWVVFIVEAGEFTYTIKDEEGIAQFGDIVICPPQTRFERKINKPLSFFFVVFDWVVPVEDLNFSDPPRGKVSVEDIPRLQSNMLHLRGSHGLHPDYIQAYRQHMLQDMWILLMQAWRKQSAAPSELKQKNSKMKKAADLIDQQALTKINIKQIAHELDLTPLQLSRQFKAAYHVNPIQYLTSIRIHHACTLLAETNWTLDHIAEECGYESGFYLSRLFQKQMNMRPSHYRDTHQL